MKSIIISFKESIKEAQSTRCITLAAMFGALSTVLSMLFSIDIGNILKLKFTFVPNTFVFYLFGPFVGVLYAAAMDILHYIIRPTGPYHFGFTFCAILTGLLYGLILYKKQLSLARIFLASLIKIMIINLILNSIWISQLYGKAYMGLIASRIIKELIMLPIETILVYLVIKGIRETGIMEAIQGKRKYIKKH